MRLLLANVGSAPSISAPAPAGSASSGPRSPCCSSPSPPIRSTTPSPPISRSSCCWRPPSPEKSWMATRPAEPLAAGHLGGQRHRAPDLCRRPHRWPLVLAPPALCAGYRRGPRPDQSRHRHALHGPHPESHRRNLLPPCAFRPSSPSSPSSSVRWLSSFCASSARTSPPPGRWPSP